MNAILYALTQIRHEIPMQILELTFKTKNMIRPSVRWQMPSNQQSLDHQIKDKVIYGRVNMDCNLSGATEVGIMLDDMDYEQYDQNTRVFRIPFDSTSGRKIVSIRTLNYINHTGIPGYSYGGGSQMMSAMKDLYQAIASMPIVATADCQLIGDNTVLVRDNIMVLSKSLGLTCLVENDHDMENLNPGSYRVYSDLVILATKAYIYNSIDIQMDQGQLSGGMNLGRIREVVDSYADANEQYKELFDTRWGKTAFTNDRPRMNRFVKSMIGRGF